MKQAYHSTITEPTASREKIIRHEQLAKMQQKEATTTTPPRMNCSKPSTRIRFFMLSHLRAQTTREDKRKGLKNQDQQTVASIGSRSYCCQLVIQRVNPSHIYIVVVNSSEPRTRKRYTMCVELQVVGGKKLKDGSIHREEKHQKMQGQSQYKE